MLSNIFLEKAPYTKAIRGKSVSPQCNGRFDASHPAIKIDSLRSQQHQDGSGELLT